MHAIIFRFIGEESVSSGEGSCALTDTPTWIIDPIDGTSNFVHGFPFSVISIGLAVNKEVRINENCFITTLAFFCVVACGGCGL